MRHVLYKNPWCACVGGSTSPHWRQFTIELVEYVSCSEFMLDLLLIVCIQHLVYVYA